MPNRGEVWLADPDPKRGTEPGKTRPVLIDGAEPLRIRVHAAGRLRRTSDLRLISSEPSTIAVWRKAP